MRGASTLPAVLLMGPTASGKSALALALAEAFGGEIVSVDSVQVYRGLDIGSAKPDPATRARVAHHLIDVIEPTEAYSAALFARGALAAIADIRARGRLPILSGGTMLYFKALIEGLSELPERSPALRARLDARAAREGWPALHAELARVDPETASRLERTDAQRIQRALEVWHLTGVPLSSLQGHRSADPLLAPTLAVALLPDRARLHQAIAARFDAMLAAGLVDELRGLRRRYALHAALPAMRCIGYRQAWAYLEGETDAAGLRARGIAATRQLAKRQFTWLRSMRFRALDPFASGVDSQLSELVRAALDPDGPIAHSPVCG
ncbi:MAG TPA: tRNA (adenosine(37)-N6)-dimethylallyltransferase MiaA [Casimicrobiaceae bacterium]|jgi:tRNA dimethylallyltransferase|nr:tRNA (adenosine(37)-N6)-dimethylallyltransferase MiaA [Casimicrobiaceae bacterium]